MSALKPTFDPVPFRGPKKQWDRFVKDMQPDIPGPTTEEVALQKRQREELARLDDQENVRLARGKRGQLGARRLLSSVRSTASAAAASRSPSLAASAPANGGTQIRPPRGGSSGAYA